VPTVAEDRAAHLARLRARHGDAVRKRAARSRQAAVPGTDDFYQRDLVSQYRLALRQRDKLQHALDLVAAALKRIEHDAARDGFRFSVIHAPSGAVSIQTVPCV
jgi:hypothetical protein